MGPNEVRCGRPRPAYRLLVSGDRTFLDHAKLVEGRFPSEATASRLVEAFRAFGWDVLQSPDDRLAGEIVASRIRNQALGLLRT